MMKLDDIKCMEDILWTYYNEDTIGYKLKQQGIIVTETLNMIKSGMTCEQILIEFKKII